jgi:hypothetical protein
MEVQEMGEVLGIGLTHYPPLVGLDENMTRILKATISQEGYPAEYRDPASWPEEMRREWGDDEGASTARRHREKLVWWFRRLREEIDMFRPDFLLIWGDDQYENFREDVIPAFCVLAYERHEAQPWTGRLMQLLGGRNVWGEDEGTTFRYPGHKQAGKYLAARLLSHGFDVAYAYQPLHHPLGHAFLNVLLYLDYDRRGLEYPLLPMQVNCYGRHVICQRGSIPNFSRPLGEDELDPPAPAPWRCFDLGRAVARALAESPWRAVVIASSSWSHAFLTAKTRWLHPDHEADARLYEALRDGRYEVWRDYPSAAIEESGQQEVLNWMCLVGAMAEMGRKPDESEFIPTWVLNSNKVFAIFRP